MDTAWRTHGTSVIALLWEPSIYGLRTNTLRESVDRISSTALQASEVSNRP